MKAHLLSRSIAILWVGTLVLFLLSPVCLAQKETNDPGQERETSEVFERARNALEARNISTRALEELRSQLAAIRETNAEIAERGSVEARALQAQLDSLGPAPAEGESEATEIAQRRSELTEALAFANAPVREARESLQRAEFLIDEVDALIRSQETTRLFERYPTPLSPSSWVAAWQDLSQFAQKLRNDVAAELQSPTTSSHVRETMPIVLVLLLFGLVTLLFVQRPVSIRLTQAAEKRQTGIGGWLFSIGRNLSYIVIPTIGATAILLTIPLLDMRPNSARGLQQLAPVMAACLIGAHWLGNTLFSPKVPSARLFSVTDDEAKSGVRLCQGLGLFLAIELILEILERDQSISPAGMSALSAPTILFAGFLLWRLSGLLRMEKDTLAEDTLESTVNDSADVHANESGFLTFLSLLIKASAIIAALLVVVGYVRLSREAIIPMVLTIALLGLAFFVFYLAIRVYRSVFRLASEEAHPIFLSIGLVIALALVLAPLIAMIWGARPSDIVEVWRLLSDGVQLGDIQLSLNSVITLTIVFALGALVTRWIQRTLQVSVLPRTRMDTGAQTAFVTGFGYLGLTLAALIAVSTAGLNLSSLAVVAGALSLGIGFGLQAVVSNFVSGIILLIERPIKEGDWIEVSGHSGFVRKISVRSTRIETFDRHDVIIPNSDLISGSVKNMTLTTNTGRLIVPVGVAYGSNLEETRSILMEAAKANNAILRYPEPMVLFVGLGDNSLDFELRCYLKEIGNLPTAKSDLLFSIYTELGRAGIEIPFPQRDLHLKDIDRLLEALESHRAAQIAAPPESAR